MAGAKLKRANKTEVDARVRIVVDWLLSGMSSNSIVEKCQSEWGLTTTRQGEKYIAKARVAIQNSVKGELEQKIAFHIALRQKLFDGLEDKKSPRGVNAAIKVADSWAEIEGIKQKGSNAKDEAPANPLLHSQVIKTSLDIS